MVTYQKEWELDTIRQLEKFMFFCLDDIKILLSAFY